VILGDKNKRSVKFFNFKKNEVFVKLVSRSEPSPFRAGSLVNYRNIRVCIVILHLILTVIKVRHLRCVYNKLESSVCTCLTQLCDGRDMYRIYYIENNYMANEKGRNM